MPDDWCILKSKFFTIERNLCKDEYKEGFNWKKDTKNNTKNNKKKGYKEGF